MLALTRKFAIGVEALAMLFLVLPSAMAQADLLVTLRNPGEILVMDLKPHKVSEKSEDRHKKVNDYWAEILVANGYHTVAIPTKSASGFVRNTAYHPASGRSFSYHILFKWDYTLRLKLETSHDGAPIVLKVDQSPFEAVAYHYEAPDYCYGTTSRVAFAALDANARGALFTRNHCQPAAYADQWRGE